MSFAIVLQNSREETASEFISGIDRETALGIIEERFENGSLTGEKYIKKSVSHWQYSDYKHLYLLSEKGYEKWLSQQKI